MSRLKSTLIGAAVGFVCLTAPASADSWPPPSSPQAAIQLGTLDVVLQPIRPSQQRYFTCFAHDQRLYFGNPYYNTAYYRFSISSERSLLQVKMIETPDASLWFHLLDSQLGFIREFKGGDDQLVEYEIERGDYYLQLLTDGSASREPDGSNHGQITFRAAPINIRAPDADPISVGTIGSTPVTRQGTLVHLTGREFPYSFPTPPSVPPLLQGVIPCPIRGVEQLDFLDEYRGEAAPGRVSVNLTINQQLGGLPADRPVGLYRWDTSSLGIGWIEIQGDSFNHPGGRLSLAVGYIGFQAFPHDFYIDYTVSLRLASTAPGPAPNPGSPAVSSFGPPPRSQCIIIGSQRIGC